MDGSGGQMLVDLGNQMDGPFYTRWLPDGSAVLYADGTALQTVRIGGGDPSPLLDAGVTVEPPVVFSPDGSLLIATASAPQFSGDMQMQLLIAGADGSEPRVLATPGLMPGGILWPRMATPLMVTGTDCTSLFACSHVYLNVLDIATHKLVQLWEISGMGTDVDWHS